MSKRLPRVQAAIAVIERGGRILICQRRRKDVLGGYWEFPGGKRRSGESWKACLRRELREELGVSIQSVRSAGVLRHRYPSRAVTLKVFRCGVGRSRPKPLASQALQWVRPSSLVRYRFPSANRLLVAHLSRAIIGQFTKRRAQ